MWHAVQDWLDPRLADLSPSDLLFQVPEAGSAGLAGELCAPRSAFATAALPQPPPPRALQPGSYTFGPLSAVPSYGQLDAGAPASASLNGLGVGWAGGCPGNACAHRGAAGRQGPLQPHGWRLAAQGARARLAAGAAHDDAAATGAGAGPRLLASWPCHLQAGLRRDRL